jgi:hypothetical protein
MGGILGDDEQINFEQPTTTAGFRKND